MNQIGMKRKRVVFSDDVVCSKSPIDHLSEEDINAQWWCQQQLQDMKIAAKSLCTTIRHVGGNMRHGHGALGMAHKKTRLMLKEDFHALVKLPLSTPEQDLNMWCARSDGRRGLERFASSEFAARRKNNITIARRAVLAEQAAQRQQMRNDPESISKLAQQHSRCARTFANFLGHADAVEAKTVYSRPQTPIKKKTMVRKSAAKTSCGVEVAMNSIDGFVRNKSAAEVQ